MHSWDQPEKVAAYVDRVGRLAPRRAGEDELVESLPTDVRRALDLGCGDGRLLAMVLDARPATVEAIGLDRSPPMMGRARAHFDGDPRVTISAHDLDEPLPSLGAFDVVTSGFAIHHLAHERKRTLFAEVTDALRPGGVFANLEVVQCATPELHDEFDRRIGGPGTGPEDVLAEVEPQLRWMRDAGLVHVDCHWRWRGFALLCGRAPGLSP